MVLTAVDIPLCRFECGVSAQSNMDWDRRVNFTKQVK